MRPSSRKKYQDFHESEPIQRRSKTPPYEIREYIDVTCPHCGVVCAEIPRELIASSKASKCLDHLRLCPSYEGSVSDAPEKKRKYTNSDVIEAVEREVGKVRTEMREMERRICHTVAEKVLLDPPPPQNAEQLVERLDPWVEEHRSIEASQRSAEANARNAARGEEQCSLCLEAGSDALLLPCLHRPMCWGCWQNMKAATPSPRPCPVCRKPISSVVAVGRVESA